MQLDDEIKQNKDVDISKKIEPFAPTNGWFTPKSWCVSLGVTKSTISRWISNGILRHTRIGKKIYIHESAIQEMLSRQEQTAWRTQIKQDLENDNQNK